MTSSSFSNSELSSFNESSTDKRTEKPRDTRLSLLQTDIHALHLV